MSCIVIDLGPNASAFVCSRGSSRTKAPCAYCKARPAELLCDQPLRGVRAGRTCDGKLCRSCAFAIPGESNRHLCPPHRKERDALEAKARAADEWLDGLARTPAPLGSREVSASRPPAEPNEACICDGVHYGNPRCPVHRVDRDALVDLFPNWNEWGPNDSPPVSQLAGEIRDRTWLDDVADDERTMSEQKFLAQHRNDQMSARIDSHDWDGDICNRCGTQGMPDGNVDGTCAELLIAQVNMYGCRRCPVCNADKRYPHRTGVIICDDCGHESPGRRITGIGCAIDIWLDEPKPRGATSRRAADAAVTAMIDRQGPVSAHDERQLRTFAGELADRSERQSIAALVLDGTREIRERVLGPDRCSRRHHRCDGCGGCAVVARDYPLAKDCRACDWRTCKAQQARVQPIAAKVEHVRNARQTRDHGCHWPGCRRQVKPAYWGCSEHWNRLPQSIRDRIWRTYRAGQEDTLTPSREYLDAVNEAAAWANEWNAANTGEPQRRGWDATVRETRAKDATRVRRCTYCGEDDSPGHDRVCKNHPDPSAQAEGSWAGDMTEDEFDPNVGDR